MINIQTQSLLFDTACFTLYDDFETPLLMGNPTSFFSNFNDKKDASPTNTKDTHCDSQEFENSFSDSVAASFKTFNETAYEDIASLVLSSTTDLNLLVDDVLSSGPKDPTIKRKRVVK